jgi:hypothetical protein
MLCHIMLCRLSPGINCVTGSSYNAVVSSISKCEVTTWAARSCYPYIGGTVGA